MDFGFSLDPRGLGVMKGYEELGVSKWKGQEKNI
jgi:hypothetical protein